MYSFEKKRNIERRVARERDTEKMAIQEKGKELRKTDLANNEFKVKNMTAQQKAELKLKRRKISLVDQVEKERNRLFGERTRAVSDAAWGKTATDRAKLQNEIFQQDFFERENGTTGRYSENPHPGKVLFNQMEGAKDKEAFFKGLSKEQQQSVQGYRGLQERMSSVMGGMPLRPTQAGATIDTSGWSANRLKRTMGEVGGSRNLDIGGGVQIPTRFNQVAGRRPPAADQNIYTTFDDQGDLVYSNNPNDSANLQKGGVAPGVGAPQTGVNYNVPRGYNPLINQAPRPAGTFRGGISSGEQVRTNAVQGSPRTVNESPGAFIRRQMSNASQALNISSVNRDRISGVPTPVTPRKKTYPERNKVRLNRMVGNRYSDKFR